MRNLQNDLRLPVVTKLFSRQTGILPRYHLQFLRPSHQGSTPFSRRKGLQWRRTKISTSADVPKLNPPGFEDANVIGYADVSVALSNPMTAR